MMNSGLARIPTRWAFAGALSVLLAACAALPPDPSMTVNDPDEALNRRVMAANQEMLGPVSEAVKSIPGPVRDRLHDLNAHLKEPRIFINDVLQGRFKAAHDTLGRFICNSIFGFGGLIDVAGRYGLPQQSGDFGQTLFVWGIPSGPYMVRPYLGPADLRDAVGSTVDMVINPMGWVLGPAVAATTAASTNASNMVVSVGSTAVDAVDRLGQLKIAEDASIDFYSFVRSSYYQMRRAELREAVGLPSAVDSPALDDPGEEAAPATAAAPTMARLTDPRGSKPGPKTSHLAAAPNTGSQPSGVQSVSAHAAQGAPRYLASEPPVSRAN
jgi:phospholipid-binding lipoprotein MlaA